MYLFLLILKYWRKPKSHKRVGNFFKKYMMKKKSFNKKLRLQKENIVNLNQLNLIKGGYEIPTGGYFTYTCIVQTRAASADLDPDLDPDLNVFL